jgi:TetR/AcrR family transcriptional regulator, repressor for uid operon
VNQTQASKAEARTQAQRERILAAARTCFVNSGFHAASMSQIAETAGMSPGLIYRYFENKSAIILAIIEDQLELARKRIRGLRADRDLADGILDHLRKRGRAAEEAMSPALFLEMSAEATRDPQIRAALRKFDRTVRSEVGGWLAQSSDKGGYGLPPEVAETRALMLVCLIEGLKVREAHDPEADGELLRRALGEIVAALVAPPGKREPHRSG